MRKSLVLLALIPILAVFNYGIFEKETLLRDGELILVALAPADPRSLMQGDYMRLRYQAAIDAAERLKQDKKQIGKSWQAPETAYLVLALDDKSIAQFVRFDTGRDKLAANERRISFRYRERWGSPDIQIYPDSFFFQEGHGSAFQSAKFGLMRLHRNGDHLLSGLADETGKQIKSRR
ncbi:GDYXXLXY domain-containing protein [Cohaesibacter celericrescens]|nr:GDYXXLXY domain-containing protein [Cohaesibacter celericrescens]